jgi:hypothetical protein
MIGLLTIAATLLVEPLLVQAHVGASLESLRAEHKAHHDYIRSLEHTNLAHCIPKLAKRSNFEQNDVQAIAKRRIEKVKLLRRERGLNEDGE